VVEIDDEGSVRCSNLDYEPLRSLLSLPQTGTAEPHEILELIAQLPDRHEGEDSSTWPYVELRVLESKPEPTFLNDVTVALKEKAVRFCRMVRVLPTDIGDSSYHLELGSEAQTALNISPADLAQYVYKNKFKQAMPEEMLTRLETIVNNTLESPQNLKA
jgi:exonuclease SbcD